MTHELKCWHRYFQEVISGRKTFEIRYDDRGFAIGDALILREYDRMNDTYSGRSVSCFISYVFQDDSIGLEAGYVILGIVNVANYETKTNTASA